MQLSGNAKDSWKLTRASHLLGINYPIIQAPFGGLASQRLTAEVSNLGGLGSLGAVTLDQSAIRDAVAEICSLTSKPFAINLWVSTSDRESSHISSDRIEEKIRQFRQYYAELGVDTPSKVEPRHQDFEAQARAVIDARPAVHAVTQTVASAAATRGKIEFMTLWAGQSATLRRCSEAAEFMTQLIAEVEACLSRVLRGNCGKSETQQHFSSSQELE